MIKVYGQRQMDPLFFGEFFSRDKEVPFPHEHSERHFPKGRSTANTQTPAVGLLFASSALIEFNFYSFAFFFRDNTNIY